MLFKADLEIPFDKNAIVQQVKTQSHTNSNTTCNRSEPERVLIVLSSVSISARAANQMPFYQPKHTLPRIAKTIYCITYYLCTLALKIHSYD